ncbi:hypothetical protein PPEP_a3289 [Pseudoalteromonas peptidolytica F12-50-A1]|uniref:Uncharacterized protein n=1 Tax=Pseudoalteromonas peptidolytica F12-50-A1 TaxID=1315280 RepID=A0A8I0T6C9_9GAMM|nr:hypothetical protein [Pseudoalteromonas peptidolytica F12-50-A1]
MLLFERKAGIDAPLLINLGQIPVNYKLNMGRKRARESNIV